MSILGPNGKPVASTRRTYLSVQIKDFQAGDTSGKAYALNFELDVPRKGDVNALLHRIQAQIVNQLSAIGFFEDDYRPSRDERDPISPPLVASEEYPSEFSTPPRKVDKEA